MKKTKRVALTKAELELIGSALETHQYWEIADESSQRHNGYAVWEPDDENAEELQACEDLMDRINRLAATMEGGSDE